MARRGRSSVPLFGAGASALGYWLVIVLAVFFFGVIIAAQVGYGIECRAAGGEVIRGIGFDRHTLQCLREGRVIEP